MPDGLLAAARAEALRPGPFRRSRPLALGMAMAATLLVVLGAFGLLAARPRPAPSPPVASPVAPAHGLVIATHGDTVDGGEVLLRPADPATALPLPGLEPIAIAQPFETRLSPDGRTLAIVSTPPYEVVDGQPVRPDSGVIRLVDLASWTVSDTPVTGLGFVSDLSWTPDSTALVWLAPTQTDADLAGRAYQVVRWAIGAPAPEVLVGLPDPAFVPQAARVVVDSQGVPRSTLVVYGRLRDADGYLAGTPRVLGIDLDRGRVAADVDLADVGPGDVRTAVVWDLPRQRLFVATDDTLLTVDLGDFVVEGHPIEALEAGASTRDRLPVLSGVVSADGDRLFLTGVTQEVTDEGVSYGPAGLRVIDTHDGRLVEPIDASISQVSLSPAGDQLLVASMGDHGCTLLDASDVELRLLDPDDLQVRARIAALEGAVCPSPLEMSISWDGRFGYLGDAVRTGAESWNQVRVIAMEDGRVVGQRTFDEQDPLVTLLVLGGRCGGLSGCQVGGGA
ncbi:MAG: hypothetical protein U0667_11080 [Chloroflexota bacterium]